MTASRSRVSSDADGIPQCAELDLGQKQRGSLTRVRPADSLPIVLGEQSKGCLKFFGGGLIGGTNEGTPPRIEAWTVWMQRARVTCRSVRDQRP